MALTALGWTAGCSSGHETVDSEEQYDTAEGALTSCIPGEPNCPVYTQRPISSGTDWNLIAIRGIATDDGGVAYSTNVYVVKNSSGITNSPLPLDIRSDLNDTTAGAKVFAVSQTIVDEIVASQQIGELTPVLEEIAEPWLTPTPIPDFAQAPASQSPNEADFLHKCSNKSASRSRSVSFNTPVTSSDDLGEGFSGNISITGNAQGNAAISAVVEIKRFRLFGSCIPYAIKYAGAHAEGSIKIDSGTSISGTVHYSNEWQTQVAKPHLGSVDFLVAGIIPVHIGFNLPVSVGLDLQASASGSVAYNSNQAATGSFSVNCTLNGCSGSANYTVSNPQGSPITGDAQSRIQPSVWAQAAVRAYLYDEWFAYAQLGVRPYVRGDLWGYYGNNCGDSDGNGTNETVDALTFDLDWQLHVTGQAAVFGGNPRKWNDIWHTNRYHIGFWDLIGSEAIQPMLMGPASSLAGMATQYSAKMRPCWPYSDDVNYSISWGDNSTTNFTGSPQAWQNSSHAWPTNGTYTMSLSAQSDTHGRQLSKATSKNVQVAPGNWTPWLDRDDETGTGDWEQLSDFVNAGQVCPNPLAVECRTTSGTDWTLAGEVYSCTVAGGGVCLNAQQPDGYCLDYQVRFLCP